MVAIWLIIGLIIAAVSVSVLGAWFSIQGLAALFSGAVVAVCAMAASLEFAKFVLAVYLHQRFKFINWLMKSYLTIAIVVLSIITSMGIFGFLSDAYQSSSATLEAETIKAAALKQQQQRYNDEIVRLNKAIDEVPANRITRKMQVRAEAEPAILNLNRQVEQTQQQISQAELRILEVKQKVGPLIYISRAFNIDIDTVVKYLILVLVGVFDPLAICLVIATSESLETRRRKQSSVPAEADNVIHMPQPPIQPASEFGDEGGEVIQMRFADETGDPEQKAV